MVYFWFEKQRCKGKSQETGIESQCECGLVLDRDVRCKGKSQETGIESKQLIITGGTVTAIGARENPKKRELKVGDVFA